MHRLQERPGIFLGLERCVAQRSAHRTEHRRAPQERQRVRCQVRQRFGAQVLRDISILARDAHQPSAPFRALHGQPCKRQAGRPALGASHGSTTSESASSTPVARSKTCASRRLRASIFGPISKSRRLARSRAIPNGGVARPAMTSASPPGSGPRASKPRPPTPATGAGQPRRAPSRSGAPSRRPPPPGAAQPSSRWSAPGKQAHPARNGRSARPRRARSRPPRCHRDGRWEAWFHWGVSGDTGDAGIVGKQERLAVGGAENLDLAMRLALETLDDDEIDPRQLCQQFRNSRLFGATQLMHQGPALGGGHQHFARTRLAVRARNPCRVYRRRRRDGRARSRKRAGPRLSKCGITQRQQGGLAGTAPSREANHFHTVLRHPQPFRHCEEHSRRAIHSFFAWWHRIASLRSQ